MLFDEQVARKPNLYPWTDEIIEAIVSNPWTWLEFDFQADYANFTGDLDHERQEIIKKAVSAIGQIEIAVKTFWARLPDNFPRPEFSDLGYVLAQNEVIHNKAYEKLLDKLDLTSVFEENLKNPIIAGRVNYLKKYQKRVYGEDKRKQYIYALILFTLFIENVSLFSQFYIILWFNRNENVLRDTAQQVQYTRNEETLHAQVGVRLINTLREEYPEYFDEELEQRVYDETRVAFEAESKVVDWMLGCFDKEGLSASVLKTFIADRLNQSLLMIGYNPVFEVNEEELEKTVWMEEGTMGNNLTDFFWQRPTAYAKHNRDFNSEPLWGDY